MTWELKCGCILCPNKKLSRFDKGVNPSGSSMHCFWLLRCEQLYSFMFHVEGTFSAFWRVPQCNHSFVVFTRKLSRAPLGLPSSSQSRVKLSDLYTYPKASSLTVLILYSFSLSLRAPGAALSCLWRLKTILWSLSFQLQLLLHWILFHILRFDLILKQYFRYECCGVFFHFTCYTLFLYWTCQYNNLCFYTVG